GCDEPSTRRRKTAASADSTCQRAVAQMRRQSPRKGACVMAHQVVWFDIPVLDLDRAIRFYSAVLGAPVKKEEFPGMSIGVLPHAGSDVSGCLHQSDADRPADHGPLLYLNAAGRLD